MFPPFPHTFPHVSPIVSPVFFMSLNPLITMMSLLYKNQSIDLQSKSMDWFLYDRDLRHERVPYFRKNLHQRCLTEP